MQKQKRSSIRPGVFKERPRPSLLETDAAPERTVTLTVRDGNSEPQTRTVPAGSTFSSALGSGVFQKAFAQFNGTAVSASDKVEQDGTVDLQPKYNAGR